jgi:hypothetical protein
MALATLNPGDRVAVYHYFECEDGALGTVIELVERFHPADGSMLRLYWVQFDEMQQMAGGQRFQLATVTESRLRRLDDADQAARDRDE